MATPNPVPDITIYDLYEELGRIIAAMPDNDDYKRMSQRQRLENEQLEAKHKDEQTTFNQRVAKAEAKAKDLRKVIQKVIAGENPLVAMLKQKGTDHDSA